MSEGLEAHQTEQGEVRVYSVAKTVVDCFRYRNRIGLDVALEALQESLRSRRVTVDELWRYAKLLRVSTVIRPYLEAIA
ncbi:MAG: transcriptional regulator-like protein [Capsulimonas sp.]|nr:transcriptional regulator-like protein [Capsulimonas sp.]